jgi:superfamily II DNA or RNA helicase
MFHFKSGAQRAAIIHPTGTGKSYCIAAIAQQFNKVAVIAPNKYVLAQIKNVCGNSVEIYTYSKITKISPTGYDLIVIDELHRMGARTWEVGIKNLLQVNPNAKVLGTTATPIRYLDNERDMAEDYFKGDVISQIELVDAMVGGILPVPHYVVGYYSLEFLNEILEISRPELVQKALEEKVGAIRENWNKSNGVPGIISRHISQNTKRIIVFFKDILDLQSSKQTVTDWFVKAGMSIYKTYEVHSKSQTNLNDFEQGGYEGTKLLFCVDMLNEGIHVSGVDAIVFLRATWSRNIWFQQMGRVMDAGKKKAVILDLVANARSIEDLSYIKNLQKLYQQKVQSLGRQIGYVGGVYEVKDFDIIDYTEDIIKLLESLRRRTSGECLIELYNFIKKEERLPLGKKNNLYRTLVKLRNGKYDKEYSNLIQEIENLCNKLGINLYTKITLTSKECLINLLNFIKKEERLPSCKEFNLYNTLGKLRNGKYNEKYSNLIQEIENLCNELEIDLYTKIIPTSKECLIDLLNFIKKEERLPFRKEYNLYHTLKSLRDGKYGKKYSSLIQEIENLCNELGINLYTKITPTPKECLIDLLNFLKKEERLPSSCKEKSLYCTLRNLYNDKYDKKYSNLTQEIKNLCNKLGINLYTKIIPTSKECLINLLNFIKKEERLPSSVKEINLYWIFNKLRNSKYDEEYPELVQEIKDLCNKLNLSLKSRKIK